MFSPCFFQIPKHLGGGGDVFITGGRGLGGIAPEDAAFRALSGPTTSLTASHSMHWDNKVGREEEGSNLSSGTSSNMSGGEEGDGDSNHGACMAVISASSTRDERGSEVGPAAATDLHTEAGVLGNRHGNTSPGARRRLASKDVVVVPRHDPLGKPRVDEDAAARLWDSFFNGFSVNAK